jgi:hypothetical protein
MEYNFNVTRRLLAIFMVCSCLFVACIFFLGFEFGKKMSGKPANGVTGLPTEITQKMEQEVQSASAMKDALVPPVPTLDKKLP